MSKIIIEIGKTYVCRDGSEFTARHYTDSERVCERVCGRDERDRVTWRSAKGRVTSFPHRRDVVREK